MAWKNPRWNSLRGQDAETLRAIFKSLEDFLSDPTFEKGLRLGNGDEPVYDPIKDLVIPPPTERVDLDVIHYEPPPDTTPPAQVGAINVLSTVDGFAATWDDVPDEDVANGVGSYEVQVSLDAAFTEPRTVFVGGNFVTFTDLARGTQYWVRARAIDSSGNKGAFSAAVTVTAGGIVIDDGAITEDKIADFAVTVKKFNTGTHQIY